MNRTPRILTWTRVTLSALVLGAVALVGSASAYEMSGVGGRIGYTTPENLDGTAAMSVHAELEQSGTRLHFMPNLSYWNVDHVSDVCPNLDAYYHFGPDGKVSPYLGGGLGINFVHDRRAFRSDDTNLGMNLLGGLRFPGSNDSPRRYFLEGRFTASDVNQVAVMTGVTFMSR